MKKYAIYGLTGILAFVFIGGAIYKLVGPAAVQDQFRALGLSEFRVPIAVLELICALLFLIPRTWVIGALLLASYMGGAMVAHLSHGESPLVPAAVLALVWLLIYLKKPDFFTQQA